MATGYSSWCKGINASSKEDKAKEQQHDTSIGQQESRPPKSAIAEVKEKRAVGRPKGTAAIINEYRDRMLASPKSAKVFGEGI